MPGRRSGADAFWKVVVVFPWLFESKPHGGGVLLEECQDVEASLLASLCFTQGSEGSWLLCLRELGHQSSWSWSSPADSAPKPQPQAKIVIWAGEQLKL